MEFISKYFDKFKVSASTPSAEEKENVAKEKKGDSYTRPGNPNMYDDVTPIEEKGFELYPERKGETYKPSLWNKIWKMEGREPIERIRCERKLYKIYHEGPMVKLMVGALKSSGCDMDLRRNFSCEVCKPGVNGGYDHRAQQVVICQNNVKNIDIMQAVVTHELIHMYDHCVNKTDFSQLEHLACTEVRAVSLTGCSILGCIMGGQLSLLDFFTFNLAKKHGECVKSRAAGSVMAARNVTQEEAYDAVERVFPQCYNDLEPIGRRMRSGSYDAYKVYLEGTIYGYV